LDNSFLDSLHGDLNCKYCRKRLGHAKACQAQEEMAQRIDAILKQMLKKKTGVSRKIRRTVIGPLLISEVLIFNVTSKPPYIERHQ
jgi:hypothetical protein